MLRNPGKLAVILEALLGCFAYESAGASLLLYAASPGSNYTAKAALPPVGSQNGPSQVSLQQYPLSRSGLQPSLAAQKAIAMQFEGLSEAVTQFTSLQAKGDDHCSLVKEGCAGVGAKESPVQWSGHRC